MSTLKLLLVIATIVVVVVIDECCCQTATSNFFIQNKAMQSKKNRMDEIRTKELLKHKMNVASKQ